MKATPAHTIGERNFSSAMAGNGPKGLFPNSVIGSPGPPTHTITLSVRVDHFPFRLTPWFPVLIKFYHLFLVVALLLARPSPPVATTLPPGQYASDTIQ